jgi:hypothetical protein
VPLLRSTRGYPQELESPAVTRHYLGDGQGFYIAADLFTAYHRCQYPGLRQAFGDVLERALPQPPMLTSAPATVEVVLRGERGRTVLHFVNHSPGKSLAQNSAYIERVPPSEPFSVTLAVRREPSSVRLQPGDAEPEWSYAEQTLTVFIPAVHIHSILVIEGADEPEEGADEPGEAAEAPATAIPYPETLGEPPQEERDEQTGNAGLA